MGTSTVRVRKEGRIQLMEGRKEGGRALIVRPMPRLYLPSKRNVKKGTFLK